MQILQNNGTSSPGGSSSGGTVNNNPAQTVLNQVAYVGNREC
ncbi:hypothetical protein [Helicobacter mustelae]|uniref:Uncharacterized protein n=1 Tax=Helicobacter mustelae (strain ATCC 43772 / CCUG 25715 / CIP 103759 / LMG 18044 / NCTC 12198 / R85-136P) TaxID=679897 RepID=D3UI11_HELM1|nr:hypothetical protein [Helicobacter mustelae]CBG40134.1 putative hypothetical protein [Helicobacter mustelae 12198]